MKLCNYCLKGRSLGLTAIGWLGCAPCQKKVDEYIAVWRKTCGKLPGVSTTGG